MSEHSGPFDVTWTDRSCGHKHKTTKTAWRCVQERNGVPARGEPDIVSVRDIPTGAIVAKYRSEWVGEYVNIEGIMRPVGGYAKMMPYTEPA